MLSSCCEKQFISQHQFRWKILLSKVFIRLIAMKASFNHQILLSSCCEKQCTLLHETWMLIHFEHSFVENTFSVKCYVNVGLLSNIILSKIALLSNLQRNIYIYIYKNINLWYRIVWFLIMSVRKANPSS